MTRIRHLTAATRWRPTVEHARLEVDAAHCHLEALDRAGAPHIFVCIPESVDASGGVRHVYGPLAAVRGVLEASQHAGCGVFVTVNAMSGRRRLKAEVARVRALWIERDGPGRVLPLEPSLIVETSRGKQHEYLLTEAADPLDADQATRLNRSMADAYDGDRQATDMARALRLAGSWHLKGEPQMVQLRTFSATRYSASVLNAAFPGALKKSPIQPRLRSASRSDRYLAAAVAGVCAKLAQAGKGTRNDTLNRAAFRMGLLGIEPTEVERLLTPVALSIGLAEREIAVTIRSGVAAGATRHAGANETASHSPMRW